MTLTHARATFVMLMMVLTPIGIHAQSSDPAAEIAAAVLPLPEAMRAEASVVSMTNGKIDTIRKGSNGMVCAHNRSVPNVFWAECYHESIIALMGRADQLARQMRSSGSAPTPKAINDAIETELKAGKFKLPDQPTIGFQMRGPEGGYDARTRTTNDQIRSWQMVILPFATGKTLGLPEQPAEKMPWVMNAGTWIAHIMIEHN